MPKTVTASRLVAAALAGLASLLSHAQVGSHWPAASAQADTVALAWRAGSRIGYAPSPVPATQALAAPKVWALQQIDAAYAASQRPAALAPEVARLGTPLHEIVEGVQAERAARQNARQAMPDGVALAPLVPALAAGQLFSREMAQAAADWRLMSCSDPALENPLLARMTEFWFNHLNVFAGKGAVRPFVGHYVLQVVRANALGRFEDLLLASARHPAMLLYLDQAQSSNRGLNENYARELMELHTLGVGGGYTQGDVRELARILTGWTVNLPGGQGFQFAERRHDTGSKTFLGKTYLNQGLQEGEDALRLLARHPATAHRVSERLAAFFVADKPPAALVKRLGDTFLATRGDIRALMRTLLASPEFWAADSALFKTPMDFACSALTAAGGVKDRRDLALAQGFLAQAGQPVHGWPTPDGYKTDAATWLAPEALTRRADFAMGLAQRIAEPVYLNAFFGVATQARIAREPLPARTGLLLAGPDFMRK